MTPPKIPDIKGLQKLTPLEMNAVHFNKRHTVLTPEVLASMRGSTSTASADDARKEAMHQSAGEQ